MKKLREDESLNRFDPLDLGAVGGDARVPKRGRPKSQILERTRTAYWAWTVRMAAAKPFAVLEREIALRTFPKRDSGGYEQPSAWLKYSKGQRSPLPPSQGDRSPVLRAEARFPGTRATYESIVWDLMYDAQSQPKNRLKLTSRISPHVLRLIKPAHIQKKDQYRILLSHEGIARLVFIRDMDAFGLMLMQWRNLDWDRADVSMIYLARAWLLLSFQWMEPFAKCRELITGLIHQNVGELGVLNGPGGLDPNKAHEERVRDAFYSATLGGVAINVPDPNAF